MSGVVIHGEAVNWTRQTRRCKPQVVCDSRWPPKSGPGKADEEGDGEEELPLGVEGNRRCGCVGGRCEKS